MDKDELEKLRNEAIATVDLKKMRLFMKHFNVEPSSDQVVLAGLHKARVALAGISQEDKDESRAWLRQNAYSESIGIPVAPRSSKGIPFAGKLKLGADSLGPVEVGDAQYCERCRFFRMVKSIEPSGSFLMDCGHIGGSETVH